MKYKAIIGLEMHCQISSTNTKVFSSAKNGFNDAPNANIQPLDMAFPGTLPVVNKEAVKKALMASMMLSCHIPKYLYFERKNYYYPDLPKGYQITQETKPAPIGSYGSLTFECHGDLKTVRINNIHLEEDSASADHFDTVSKLDYNRAGIPLLELVTEPDFRSAEEAVSFLETMRQNYQYAGISEADSKKGQIRCDVNISIMDASLEEIPENYGTKVEIKNVNSFGGVRDTIHYEIKRQIELKKNGKYEEMEQQTRRWDEQTGTTIYMRGKVDAIDYKYFIEPNIPKIKLDSSWLEEIRRQIPTLALERKQKYIEEYGLSHYDATNLVKEKEISDYYEECLTYGASPKSACNWLTSVILGYMNKYELKVSAVFVTPKMLADLMQLVEKGSISSKQAKEVLNEALMEDREPLKIIEEKGIRQMEDNGEIEEIVKEVFREFPNAKEEYKAGKTNIVDFLVGQVMKKTRGKANPAITMQFIKEEMDS